MTNCTKGGIKIKNNNNDYKTDPFAGINPFHQDDEERKTNQLSYSKNNYNNIDLNIDNYSREELYKLFGLKISDILTEERMKESKKIVLKTHPDKSQLENKYFLFFSNAYKRLYSIYEFQNKSFSQKKSDTNDYNDKTNSLVLDKMFDMNSNLKKSNNFNEWFNEQFEKHRIDDLKSDTGYGSWLKSDEDIVFNTNVTQSNMNSEIEKRKREVKEMTIYNGVNNSNVSSLGASALMEYNSNFTSNTLFSNEGMGYTDLRQAYVESVIPVTQDDYNQIKKYKNVEDYKRERNGIDIKPLDKEESMKQLYMSNKNKDEESAALAFYYAQQSEKVKKNQDMFWSGLKQVTNW
jgi:hypothetical protein